MAGLIKNQILKHLSKFAKNVSANSINVSTLRGEGELFNLDLNENVLNELLELPSWMKIVQAFVNRVSLKIQWTKLKSTPIVVSLDEVQVVIETVNDPKSPTVPQHTASYMSGGKYGFSDKVIDGITVTINSVIVRLKSPIFEMSFQISRMLLCSKSPTWQTSDLRMTRLKDPFQQHVLIFKELTWETLKFEAKPYNGKLMPIRLITNRSCCRITIKKKFSDCSVVGCRLVLFMDDILWVLTDSQLITAFEIAESLEGVIKKSTQESQKEKAARKLESIPSYNTTNAKSGDYSLSSQGYVPGSQENTLGVGAASGGFWSSPSQSQINSKLQIFRKFDVVETSYHFFSDKIGLHLCDDPGRGRSSHPDLQDGGSLQIELKKLKIDFYPYHLALGERTHWIKYPDGSLYKWTRNSLNQFKKKLFDSFSGTELNHAPLERASPHVADQGIASPHSNSPASHEGRQLNTGQSFAESQFRKLMSTCFIFSCADLVVNFVTVCQRKNFTHQIFSGDSKRKCFPPGTPFIHLESTYFFYPGGFNFPVPPPKLYVQAGPTVIAPERKSSLWANAFAGRLNDNAAMKNKPVPPYMDICIEALMPKVIIRPADVVAGSLASYVSMHAFVSRVYISNVRESDPASAGSRSSLFTCLEAAQSGELFFASGFPSKSHDMQPISSKFLTHALGTDYLKSPQSIDGAFKPPYKLESDTLWTESRDIFFMNLDPVWVDFAAEPPHKTRPQPFVYAFPLHLWLYVDLTQPAASLLDHPVVADDRAKASVSVIAHTPNLVSAQVDHRQLVFLMRLLDWVTELGSFLAYDVSRIRTVASPETLLFAAILPQVDVSLVMPVVDSSSVSSPSLRSHEEDERQAEKSPENVSIDPGDRPAFDQSIDPLTDLSTDERNLSKSQSEGCLPSVIEPEGAGDARSISSINTVARSPKEKGAAGGSLIRKSITGGFSSILTTIDGNTKSPSDDVCDNMSIASDLSNESDNFAMVYLNEGSNNGAGFEHCETVFGSPTGGPATEIATEVLESPIAAESPDQQVPGAEDNRMVTVVTFSVCKPQVIYETAMFDSTIKIQSNAISCEEVHRCRYDEFQREFVRKNKLWSVQGMKANPCVFRVRLETTGEIVQEQLLSASRELFRKCFEEDHSSERYSTMLPVKRDALLEAEVRNVALGLYNSTGVSLLSLLDDELVPLPLPFKVSIHNINVVIKEEKETPFGLREFSYAIHIPHMLAKRDLEGNISLHEASSIAGALGSSVADSELQMLQTENQRLKEELEELRTRVDGSQRENTPQLHASLNGSIRDLI